jgi:His/Glu/Gln/Arg/opine family amino acid ABC transporter permease subunit
MDVAYIVDILPDILKGLSTTVSLFLWSMLFSSIVGLVLALIRLSPLAPLRWFAGFYSWLFRGVPLLLIMFYVFFAFPELGEAFLLEPFWAAVASLSLWTASYQAEAIRSGILAVDSGQFEAAEALGMTRAHYMRRIVLPQSVRIIVPPFMGNAINTLKQTSLATVITVPEMALLTTRIISRDFKALEPLLALALIYLFLTTLLVFAQQGLERTFRLKV